MSLKRNYLLRIIAEVSFMYALAFPMIKSISNVGWLYIFFQSYADIISLILYLIVLILFPALFPTKKKLSSYIHGTIIFSFYTMYIIMGESTISPSFLLMIIICFGRPFWDFRLKSINIFIITVILTLIILSLNIRNLLVLLSEVNLGGQNYLAALVFGTVYLGTVFNIKIKPIRGILATTIGSIILIVMRSRTAVLAIIPLLINIFTNYLGKIQKLVVLVPLCVLFLYYNPLSYILNKYGDSSYLMGFMSSRGDVWLRSFDYALSNLFSPLAYVSMDFPERHYVLGAPAAHNWILENTLMFGLFGIIPIFLTIWALIRNFYYFLPLFLFAMFEPTIFYISNTISFLFLNFLINHKNKSELFASKV